MQSLNLLKKGRDSWMNKWFFRLLFSYLPLFIIVLGLIFTAFLQSYSQRNKEELRTVSEYINLSIMHSIDNELKSIFRQTSNELGANNAIMLFFSKRAVDDEIMNYNVMSRLQDLKDTYPLIDSLYTVRYSDGAVIGNDFATDIAHHRDKTFIEEQKQQPYTTGWSSIRYVESEDRLKGHEVISLIRKGNPFSEDSGMLIINIAAASLQSVVEGLVGNNYPYVHIKDMNGKALIGGSNTAKNSASVVEAPSLYTGWTYSIQWLDRKAPYIYNTIPKLTIMIMVIASLAGIVGFIFVSYRNYRPVRAITSIIDEYTQKEFVRITQHTNEIKYIENAMNTLINKSLESQELVEADKLSKQHQFFRVMLEGGMLDQNKWLSDENRLNDTLSESSFTVIVLEIDHYPNFMSAYSQRDQDLLKYVVRSMAQEVLLEHKLTNWAEWTDASRMACIVASPSISDQKENIYTIYASIVEWVQQHLHFTITIGAGSTVDHSHFISKSFKSAQYGLNFKAALGLNRYIAEEHFAHSQPVPLSRYYALTKKVASTLRFSRHEAQEKTQELFNEMRHNLADNTALEAVAAYFTIQVEQEMSMLSLGNQNGWAAIRDGFRLEEAETIDECESIITAMLDAVSLYMHAIKESRLHQSQLDQIRDFVTVNFEKHDLSLDLLSGQFGLNAKYISKLFKETFGHNFTDFLISLRVQHACKLLEETDEPIQDIAEWSGYTNSISFRRTFKKVMGLTPGEYRHQKRV